MNKTPNISWKYICILMNNGCCSYIHNCIHPLFYILFKQYFIIIKQYYHLFSIREREKQSRLTNEDSDSDYAMHGFTLFRNDQHSHNQHRPSHGLAVYVKEEIDVQIVDLYSSKHIEWMFLKPNINDSDIQIICIYNSNDTSHQTLTSTFLQYLYPLIDHCKPLVIIGDFNINCNINTIPITIREILETLKCQQKVTQLTTDSSIIDLIITNIDNIQTGIINTAWSDHKLIWARI